MRDKKRPGGDGLLSTTAEPRVAMIRTKIVATMGPAVGEPRTLRALLEAGVDVCRLNFSHGSPGEHADMLAVIREQADKLDKPVAVLGDLGGPKIRLGEVADADGSGGMPVRPGDELVVKRGAVVGADGVVGSTYPGLVDDVQVGHRVLVEDGLLRFVCVSKGPDRLVLQCLVGGVLKTRKGVNLPNTDVNLPSVTERDWEYVRWATENKLDYLALSFVRRAEELNQLREHLSYQQSQIALIAKIEKAEALEDIDRILAASDGLMIARGDLGVEMDLAKVPIIQKDLVRRCQRAGKPVIVATQMLQSMVDSASPTRAETSDVANAVFDGADAVMLSGETSVGKFPVASVHVMAHIAHTTEEYLISHPPEMAPVEAATDSKALRLSGAAARAVRRLVHDLSCRLVVVYSTSGDTARMFAKQRFPVPVVALSADRKRLRQMSLHYGVAPLYMEAPGDLNDLVKAADKLLLDRDLASPGERVVVVAGRSMGLPGTMNGIIVHTVGGPGGEEA